MKFEGATTLPLDSFHGRNELTLEKIHFERVFGDSLTLNLTGFVQHIVCLA